jgi:hypothetical protein
VPIFERPYDTLDELHSTELEHLRIMFESGTPLAVPAAMAYCAKHGLNPPRWLVERSAKMHLAEKQTNVPKKREGRSSGVVSRNRQDAIDFIRWDTVVGLKEQRLFFQTDVKILAALKGQPAKKCLKDRKELLEWIGTGSDFIFEVASALLIDTPAFNEPDAVKKSYQTVQRNMRAPATAARYHMLDPEFLSRFTAPIKLPASQAK